MRGRRSRRQVVQRSQARSNAIRIRIRQFLGLSLDEWVATAREGLKTCCEVRMRLRDTRYVPRGCCYYLLRLMMTQAGRCAGTLVDVGWTLQDAWTAALNVEKWAPGFAFRPSPSGPLAPT